MIRFIGLTFFCLIIRFNHLACINEYGTTLKGENVTVQTSSDGFIRPDRPSKKQLLRERDTLYLRYQRTGDLTYYSDYGVKLIQLGHYQQARKVFLFIEKKQPGLYATAANLGTTYELLGQNDSALVWIRKGIKINPESHKGSEWIHERILLFKLGKVRPHNGSILGLDFGKGKIPNNKRQYDLQKLLNQISYQLQERLYFVKPPDAAVAHLYFDYATILAQTGIVESALFAYYTASAFGLKEPLLHERIVAFTEISARNMGRFKDSLMEFAGRHFQLALLLFFTGLIAFLFMCWKLARFFKKYRKAGLLLLLFISILSSCCKSPPKVVFYYRDGSVIRDTAQLFFVKRQLSRLLSEKEMAESELHVQTYLVSEQLPMDSLCSVIEKKYKGSLEWRHSDFKAPNLDSLCEIHHLFSIGVIALENKTGNIVFTQSNDTGSEKFVLFEDHKESYANAVFSFALAMKKYQPHDTYIDANGEKTHFSFYHAFADRRYSFALAQNNHFSGKEATEIVHQLLPDRVPKKRNGFTPYLFEEELSMIDLAQIWSLLQQEGIYRKPAVIRSVKNVEGKHLYKHVRRSKRTLDRTTAIRVLQLADFKRKVFGEGVVILPLKDVPPYLYSGFSNGNNVGGTYLFVTPDYTIVIHCEGRGFRLNNFKLKIQRIASPIWKETIKALRNGKQGPAIPKYVNLLIPEGRFKYPFIEL